MSTYRRANGFMEFHLSKSPKIDLHINRSVNDEIFSSLHYLSEIEDVGFEVIRSTGVLHKQKIKKIFLDFQAFIRQGKTFFKSAEALEYRAQPLFYYYSFLNLAKAYLCLNDHSLFNRKLYHGLVHKHKYSKFTEQCLTTNNGVFSHFYFHITGEPIKRGTVLNISNLFSYISEIAYEFSLVNYGPRRVAAGKSRIFGDNNNNTFWPFLAIIKNEEIFKNRKYFKSLFDNFDIVEIPKREASAFLDINAEKIKYFMFLQGKKIYNIDAKGEIPGICSETLDIVSSFVKPINSKVEFDFNIFLPLKRNYQINFNDTLAAYVIMYYLGSLVRYFPDYLEKLLSSKHAWLIENFTKSVSTSFLLNINNLIQKKSYQYY